MVFLQPLFELIESKFGETINHFPLVELIFYSIDQTLFYFIFWLIGRGIVLGLKKKKKKPIKWRREVVLNLFIFYILLLIHLTVFRAENSINNVSIVMRPLSEINWIPFVETAKLTQGTTLFDYYYNLYGNIIWFIPMGFGAAYLMKRNHFVLRSLLIGIAVSVLIESLQFIFYTGVSDIDDVIFNTIGTIIGIGLFKISHWIYKKRQIGKPLEKEWGPFWASWKLDYNFFNIPWLGTYIPSETNIEWYNSSPKKGRPFFSKYSHNFSISYNDFQMFILWWKIYFL